MINISKYDIIVVKFPFASSLKYKARPAVVISSDTYNKNTRDTLLIMAISSSIDNKLDFEVNIQIKSSIATIEKDFVITKLGTLSKIDIDNLEKMIEVLC